MAQGRAACVGFKERIRFGSEERCGEDTPKACVSKRMVGVEGGIRENFREVEFLLQNRRVSGQNPLGSKYQDEKKRNLVFQAVRSYWSYCSLGVMNLFDGLGRLVWQ